MRNGERFLVCLAFAAIGGVAMSAAQQPHKPAYPKPQIEHLDVAPDFTLPDQDGQALKLSALRGKPVVLYFYRGYW